MKEEINWIPVKKEIPKLKEWGDILGYWPLHDCVTIGFIMNEVWYSSNMKKDKVSHWARMPKGPRKKSK